MTKKAKNSRPQSSAASEAADKTTSAAPAGSQKPATNPAAEAGEASGEGQQPSVGSQQLPIKPGAETAPAEPSKAPAGVAGASSSLKLKAASIVVCTRPGREQARYRIGRAFTREETIIALADLTEKQLEALRADRDLVVTDHKPGQEG
jgi:hypothetical protein